MIKLIKTLYYYQVNKPLYYNQVDQAPRGLSHTKTSGHRLWILTTCMQVEATFCERRDETKTDP